MSYEKERTLKDGTRVFILSRRICSPTCEHWRESRCEKFQVNLDQGTIDGDKRCNACLQAEVKP
jgi:hypothetical protein